MTAADRYYDSLETRDPETREKELFEALGQQIGHAQANSAYFAEALKDVEASAVTDYAALANLPVTRKSDLVARF